MNISAALCVFFWLHFYLEPLVGQWNEYVCRLHSCWTPLVENCMFQLYGDLPFKIKETRMPTNVHQNNHLNVCPQMSTQTHIQMSKQCPPAHISQCNVNANAHPNSRTMPTQMLWNVNINPNTNVHPHTHKNVPEFLTSIPFPVLRQKSTQMATQCPSKWPQNVHTIVYTNIHTHFKHLLLLMSHKGIHYDLQQAST